MQEGVTVFVYAYVDDIYLLAVSSTYQKNCDGLKVCHDGILGWAAEAGVTFSPHKYKVMHFKSPLSTEENCKLMPDIPGLQDPEKCLKTGLKILGVEVDHQLRWDNHLEHIKAKVEKQMRYFQRISGSIWGLSLAAARRVYLAKIRPIISYACGVWFIHSSVKNTTLRWRLSKKNMKLLDDLQSECLKKISGALGRCSPRVLEKELNIENIHVFLSRAAMSDRAKTLTVTSSYPYVNGAHVERKQYAPQTSPYQVLNGEARDLCVRARRLLEENCKKQSSGDRNVWVSKWLDPLRPSISDMSLILALADCR
ncbi:hypothetical protein AUP68_07299 [Ilyonectria robusta]